MSSEYTMLPLGAVAKVRSGYAFKSLDMGTEGHPVIKIGNIEPPLVQIKDCDRISSDVVRKTPSSGRYVLCEGDILIAMTGATAGKTGRFPATNEVCYLNQRVGKVYLTDGSLIDYNYLYQVLSRQDFADEILLLADGSAQGNVSGALIETYEIPIPPSTIQKAIAYILGTLDDKIELNRKTNETLEAMAKALFKSWFVDFDPVRAKAEGRPRGLPDAISDLFPDSFEDSELGEIPNGWEVGEVGHIVKLNKESIDPSAHPEEIFHHYSIPSFDTGKFPAREPGASIKSQKFLIGENDVLVSKLNPSTPRIWIPFVETSGRSICSTEFLVCQATANAGRAFTYCLACSDAVIEAMIGLAGGTSNSHQRIRPSDFLSLTSCLGSLAIREAFNAVVEPLLRQTLRSRSESRSLATIRDTLLPKLISGEIRIPDAERLLEEVGV